MSDLPIIITDLAYILIVAGITTIIFKRLKQPLVLGYIVAGFLTGPNMIYMPSITNMENVEDWGQIGVIFLMFALGLEFSFKKIVKMGVGPVICAFPSSAACWQCRPLPLYIRPSTIWACVTASLRAMCSLF